MRKWHNREVNYTSRLCHLIIVLSGLQPLIFLMYTLQRRSPIKVARQG